MPRQAIQDEFTNLPISRQRKYQLRKVKAGLCLECGKPAVSSKRCLQHFVAARELNRARTGARRRNDSQSYRLERALNGTSPAPGTASSPPPATRVRNSGREIHDEFSHLPIARQQKYQLRMAKQGCCTKCGEPLAGATLCLKHLLEAREWNRKVAKSKRRYTTAMSYQLEQAASKGNAGKG